MLSLNVSLPTLKSSAEMFLKVWLVQEDAIGQSGYLTSARSFTHRAASTLGDPVQKHLAYLA